MTSLPATSPPSQRCSLAREPSLWAWRRSLQQRSQQQRTCSTGPPPSWDTTSCRSVDVFVRCHSASQNLPELSLTDPYTVACGHAWATLAVQHTDTEATPLNDRCEGIQPYQIISILVSLEYICRLLVTHVPGASCVCCLRWPATSGRSPAVCKPRPLHSTNGYPSGGEQPSKGVPQPHFRFARTWSAHCCVFGPCVTHRCPGCFKHPHAL